jgi:protein Mpv17
MATLSSIATHKLPQLSQSIAETKRPNCPSTALSTQLFNKSNPSNNFSFSTRKRRNWVIGSVTEDREVAPVKNNLAKDEESLLLLSGSEEFQPVSSSKEREEDDDHDRLVSKAINATIVLGFGTFAVTKLLTIDNEYWHVSGLVYQVFAYIFFLLKMGICVTWLCHC